MAIKYQMYGIKDESGKYYPVRYSFDTATYEIRIDAKGYGNIPCPAGVKVENDTDIMTDYFDNDRFSLTPAHPDYMKAMSAMLSLWMKGGNHIFDYDMGDFEKRKAAYMRRAERLGTTEETATKLAEIDVKQYNDLCDAFEEARTLSNKIDSGEYSPAEYDRIKAKRLAAKAA